MVEPKDSILQSVKKVIGFAPDYDEFDLDIIMHINTTFSVLNQIGVSPPDKYFFIEDENDTWEDFLQGRQQVNMVKTYMALKVRSILDPPTTSYGIENLNKLLQEYEVRLNYMELVFNPDAYKTAEELSEKGTIWIVDDNEPLPEDMEVGELAFSPATGNVWRKA